MSGPLAGVKVIDLTVNILGPVATQVLGDMGADIIKVEPPAGDPIRVMGPSRSPAMSVFFLNTNRNKRSVVLDLKQPEALQALLTLIDGADVFVHYSAIESSGYRSLEENQRVEFNITQGQKGPQADAVRPL